jgi:metallo-beta-lactamase family protein
MYLLNILILKRTLKNKFLGADETVTGSKHLIIGDDANILIDCGLYQGSNSKIENIKIESLLKQEKINAIILTHAHLDNCGYLPKFYKDGFHGPIFTTVPTKSIAEVVMKDNAHIQQKKLTRDNQKHLIENETLYSETEVSQVLSNFILKDFNEKFSFMGFNIILQKAGHILAASSPYIEYKGHSVTFSGDLGRSNDLLMPPFQSPFKIHRSLSLSRHMGTVYMKQLM